MRRVAAAPSGSPDAPMCPGQGAQDIRAWEPGHRSVEVALLTFRVWHACARSHRNKKNLHAMLRSSSELVSLSDHLRLLVACRPPADIRTATEIRPLSAPVGRLAASHYEGQRSGESTSRGGTCEARGRSPTMTDARILHSDRQRSPVRRTCRVCVAHLTTASPAQLALCV
jgi:hypothetical protein